MARLETEYGTLLEELADPATASDPTRLRDLSRRRKELEEPVAVWRELQRSRGDIDAARELAEESQGDERELAREELARSEEEVGAFEAQLRGLLLPKDPNDGRNVIVEIRGAEGGEEANLFAKDLYDMYLRYADRRGWRVDVLDARPSDLGGLDSVTFVL